MLTIGYVTAIWNIADSSNHMQNTFLEIVINTTWNPVIGSFVEDI